MSLTVPKAGVTPLLDIDDAEGVAEVTAASHPDYSPCLPLSPLASDV